MNIWIYFFKAPKRVITISRRRSVINLKRQMRFMKVALAQEKEETIEMLATYKKYSMGQASRAEMKQANAQFIDLLKGTGLGIFAVLPFAPITIPLVVKLGSKLGIDILPSAFYLDKEKDKQISKKKETD